MTRRSKLVRGVAIAAVALAAAGGGAMALEGQAASKAQKVDDFQLADQNFIGRHLYKMKDAKAVVLMT